MNLYTNDHRLGRSAHLFLKEWQSRRYLEWYAGAEVALRREGVLARTGWAQELERTFARASTMGARGDVSRGASSSTRRLCRSEVRSGISPP
jgi:hypothetical protein